MGWLHKDARIGGSSDRPIHGSRHTLAGFVHTTCVTLPASSADRTAVLTAFQTARLATGLGTIADVLSRAGLVDTECEACFPKLPFLELFQYKY